MLRLPRTLYAPEHLAFGDAMRRFLAAEITPHMQKWEEEGMVPKSAWRRFGDVGALGAGIPEEYGGAGEDFLTLAIAVEEHARAGMAAPAFELHTGIVAPYLVRHGNEAQKRAWLPRMASGEVVASIGMTEPNSGSDLAAVRTRAVRDGDHYVVNGSKIFITNGIVGDLVVLVVKTAPELKAKGVSLLLVDTSLPGYRKARNVKKVGNKAQDTAELFFDDVRVPAHCLLGEENGGWKVLMSELVQERLLVAVRAAATCEAALEMTVRWVKERQAFGGRVFDFQNTRFRLADVATQTQALRVFTDRCIDLHARGELDMHSAAMSKLYSTEVQDSVLDTCMQLHGGTGYMWDYPIGRMWADARVHRIYAGTNEIMREIIGRAL
ncbi:MAG: acyl-CoA dehydrogenase family protein [Burkholderiales bacterium]|nr:acyl-CoA dehydrogenase family protein [Burkholderiales bacterium]